MTTHTEAHHDDPGAVAPRRRRRATVVTLAAAGVVATMAVVDASPTSDTGAEEIALGSTWS